MTHPRRAAAGLLGALLLGAAGPVAPTITAGQILTPAIDVTQPPPAPKVKLQIDGIADSIMFIWTGPSGQTFNSWFVGGLWSGSKVFQAYNAATPAQGFELAFNLYTQPGKWKLSSIEICNQVVMCTSYGSAQLNTLFGNLGLKITNPNHFDIAPPVASAAVITTPSVSLAKSPTVRINLTARDNLSGIFTIAVQLNTPGQFNPIYVFANLASNDIPRAGTFRLSSVLAPTTPTGTYTVSSVFLEDYAGNIGGTSDSAQIATLFGGKTTIDVTQ